MILSLISFYNNNSVSLLYPEINMLRWISALLFLFMSHNSFALDIQADTLYPRVEFDTSLGKIVVELDRHAHRSLSITFNLCRQGEYDNTIFHRVISDFVVQGGGLTLSMKSCRDGKPIINESGNGLTNSIGTIAMARKTSRTQPHASSTSTWPTILSSTHPNAVGVMPYLVK